MKINKKAALHNLGCKVNAYETEAMQQILENAGYEIVPFTEFGTFMSLIPVPLRIWRTASQDRCCTRQKR